jgi:hypothetical protein
VSNARRSGTCRSPNLVAPESRLPSRFEPCPGMLDLVASIIHVIRALIVLASPHRSFILESLALRQPLAIHRRTAPKPAMRWSDRLFWLGLRQARPKWKSALVSWTPVPEPLASSCKRRPAPPTMRRRVLEGEGNASEYRNRSSESCRTDRLRVLPRSFRDDLAGCAW